MDPQEGASRLYWHPVVDPRSRRRRAGTTFPALHGTFLALGLGGGTIFKQPSQQRMCFRVTNNPPPLPLTPHTIMRLLRMRTLWDLWRYLRCPAARLPRPLYEYDPSLPPACRSRARHPTNIASGTSAVAGYRAPPAAAFQQHPHLCATRRVHVVYQVHHLSLACVHRPPSNSPVFG